MSLCERFLKTVESPYNKINNRVDINKYPEAMWEQARTEDSILGKLHIGEFRALFPNRPYTPEGFHFMLSPQSGQFESIDSISVYSADAF